MKRLLAAFPLVLLASALTFAQAPAQVNLPAPELEGRQWLNTPDGKPVTLASRHDKVTILHFWTYACINCRHNLPVYARWEKRFAGRDVLIVGVHTPETDAERQRSNVARQVRELGITYPVLLDPGFTNWRNWNQQFWPTVYLIDKRGRVRYRWEGELNYERARGEELIAQAIERLLAEPSEPDQPQEQGQKP